LRVDVGGSGNLRFAAAETADQSEAPWKCGEKINIGMGE
jgi:hypothetical protein